MCAVNPIYFVSQQESPLEATKWWCPGDLWTTWPHYNAINLNYSLLTTHRVCKFSIHIERECVCRAPYTHSYICVLSHSHAAREMVRTHSCVCVCTCLYSHKEWECTTAEKTTTLRRLKESKRICARIVHWVTILNSRSKMNNYLYIFTTNQYSFLLFYFIHL